MKKILLTISLTLIAATLFGQWQWIIDFESPLYSNRIVRDTVTNPNCTWQVGHPNKTVFTSAHSVPNSIVTDTVNPVPAIDTSIFYLKHVRDQSAPFHSFALHFWYQMDGDTTDFGTIEISPDTGNTWVNVLTQDTTYQMYWFSPKPTLTGSTSGWSYFDLDMMWWASGWGTFPVAMTADTILFRFTYITDSSSTSHDGWMIDDFYLDDSWEGIQEIQNDNLISITPNPASNELQIHRMKISANERVQVLSYTGQVLIDYNNFHDNMISTKELSNGIYLFKYSNTKNFSIKKFIIQH